MVDGDPANHLMVIVEGQGVAQLGLGQGLMSLGLVGPREIVGLGVSAGWADVSSFGHGADSDACGCV